MFWLFLGLGIFGVIFLLVIWYGASAEYDMLYGEGGLIVDTSKNRKEGKGNESNNDNG